MNSRHSAAMAIGVLVLVTTVHAQWPTHLPPAVPKTADGKPDLAAPPPRTADGKVDFSGVWETTSGRAGQPRPQTPAAGTGATGAGPRGTAAPGTAARG